MVRSEIHTISDCEFPSTRITSLILLYTVSSGIRLLSCLNQPANVYIYSFLFCETATFLPQGDSC